MKIATFALAAIAALGAAETGRSSTSNKTIRDHYVQTADPETYVHYSPDGMEMVTYLYPGYTYDNNQAFRYC